MIVISLFPASGRVFNSPYVINGWMKTWLSGGGRRRPSVCLSVCCVNNGDEGKSSRMNPILAGAGQYWGQRGETSTSPRSLLYSTDQQDQTCKNIQYIYINIKVLFCGLHLWLHKKTSQCWRTKWAASDVYDYESFWQRDQLKILLNVCETCRWLFVSFCLCCCL